MALEKIFDDEDSAYGMGSGEENDLDRQLENESGDRGEKLIMTITKWSLATKYRNGSDLWLDDKNSKS